MLLSELMTGFTPSPTFEGFTDGDAKILAIDVSADGTGLPATYAVAQPGIMNIAPALNPIATDRNYLGGGMQTHKLGQHRTFKITGDRKIGDECQDFLCAFERTFGRGAKVLAKYLYFDQYTGKGEQGTVAIIVNSDGSGEAGNTSQIDVDLKAIGGKPTAYTYTAA